MTLPGLKQNGIDAERPQLKDMLAYIHEGDIIVVEPINRIARNITTCLLS